MEIVPWTYNNPRVDRQKLKQQQFIFNGYLLKILQDTDKEIDVNKNTAFKLWDGAYLLARFLESKSQFPAGFWKGKKCIEIGAGCGLVGQVAWLLGATVTLTDLNEAIGHTQKCLDTNAEHVSVTNRQRNRNSSSKDGCAPDKCRSYQTECDSHSLERSNIDVRTYAWGAGVSSLEPPYDFVFGSDIIYQPRLAKDITKALTELSGPHTKILVSYKARGLGEHVTFDLLRKRGFVIDNVGKADHPQDFQHSDYDILTIYPQ